MPSHSKFFLLGCLVEGGLGLLAIGLNWLFDKPLLSQLVWNTDQAWQGAIAAVPPFAFFLWTLATPWKPLAEIRHFLTHVLRQLFLPWSVAQLLVISLLAGIGEELLFRGAIQSNLSPVLGATPALLLGALLFGLCHSVTPTYVIVTIIMGIYLGLLQIVTNSLLVPVMTHALYDFCALVYFLRFHSPDPAPPAASGGSPL